MKITKEDAKVLWLTIGKVAVGSILTGVGLVTALNGAAYWGGTAVAVTLHDAAPEEYQKITDKITG